MEQFALERLDVMKDFLLEEINCLKEKRLRNITKQFLDNEKNLKDNLQNALKELALEEEEGVLTISYLRAGYIINNYEFHIAFYTGDPFVEEEPKCVYFSMKSLFQTMEKDFKEMDRILEKNFLRSTAAEKEEIHRWYVWQIYNGFGAVLKLFFKNIEEEQGKKVYFGGFMDQLELIGRI